MRDGLTGKKSSRKGTKGLGTRDGQEVLNNFNIPFIKAQQWSGTLESRETSGQEEAGPAGSDLQKVKERDTRVWPHKER